MSFSFSDPEFEPPYLDLGELPFPALPVNKTIVPFIRQKRPAQLTKNSRVPVLLSSVWR
jgi:hypothetical protein